MMTVQPLKRVGIINLMVCQHGKLNGMMPRIGPNGVALIAPSVTFFCQLCDAAASANQCMASMHFEISARDSLIGFLISSVIVWAMIFLCSVIFVAHCLTALQRSSIGACCHS